MRNKDRPVARRIYRGVLGASGAKEHLNSGAGLGSAGQLDTALGFGAGQNIVRTGKAAVQCGAGFCINMDRVAAGRAVSGGIAGSDFNSAGIIVAASDLRAAVANRPGAIAGHGRCLGNALEQNRDRGPGLTGSRQDDTIGGFSQVDDIVALNGVDTNGWGNRVNDQCFSKVGAIAKIICGGDGNTCGVFTSINLARAKGHCPAAICSNCCGLGVAVDDNTDAGACFTCAGDHGAGGVFAAIDNIASGLRATGDVQIWWGGVDDDRRAIQIMGCAIGIDDLDGGVIVAIDWQGHDREGYFPGAILLDGACLCLAANVDFDLSSGRTCAGDDNRIRG